LPSQSSVGMAVRALVMLACLVAVPLTAIFGTSLPEIAGDLLDKKWPALQASVDEPSGGPAGFEPMVSTDAAAILPSGLPSGRAPSQRPPLSPLSGPAERSPVPWPNDSGSRVGAERPIMGKQQSAIPPADQFTGTLQRLRQCGVTYFLLELWGTQGQYYRFQCEIPIGGNSSFTRHLEAIDEDPLQAMAEVLRQIEQPRAGDF
jgi:hypothetical protein